MRFHERGGGNQANFKGDPQLSPRELPSRWCPQSSPRQKRHPGTHALPLFVPQPVLAFTTDLPKPPFKRGTTATREPAEGIRSTPGLGPPTLLPPPRRPVVAASLEQGVRHRNC